MQIKSIRDCPNMIADASKWFSEKWGIPEKAYFDSMSECIMGRDAVPQWYLAVENDNIIGGCGVIENDFHNRPDLTPNVCAVYVEPEFRCMGVAGKLLNHACEDMKRQSIDTLYLVTDHIGFYERYGWEYLCDVVGSDGNQTRMYIHKEV